MRSVLFLVLLLFSLKSYTQNDSIDLNYIEEHRNKLILSIHNEGLNNTIEYHSKDEDLEFSTNVPSSYGFGMQYKWLRFNINILKGKGFSNRERELTNKFKFGINLCKRKWLISYTYRRYKGHYIEIDDKIISDNAENTKLISNRLSFLYYFNGNRYSYKTALFHSERQKRSAGSLVTGVSLMNDYFYFGDNIILSSLLTNDTRSFENRYLAYKLGYAHSFAVYDRFHFSFGVVPGISFQRGRINKTSGISNIKNTVSFYLESRFSIGYNTDKYFFGFDLSNDTNVQKYGDMIQEKSDVYIKFSIARKFDIDFKRIFKRKKHY
ncbi:MAG: DUF4421 domain-containing protein [Marinifilaceae bacterium]|jgi:hypothetical protein|nr:DUF4421 domain-containing protein [Marinifilaceae bacterium]